MRLPEKTRSVRERAAFAGISPASAVSVKALYVQWWRRYERYLAEIPKEKAAPDSDSAKAFLTRLAMIEKIAASTQNQAFNALLFTFRQVQDYLGHESVETTMIYKPPQLAS